VKIEAVASMEIFERSNFADTERKKERKRERDKSFLVFLECLKLLTLFFHSFTYRLIF